MASVEERVRQIIASEAQRSPESVRPDSTIEELGLSSVDLVQITFLVEEEFDIYLSDQETAFGMENVGQVIAAVERLLAARAESRPAPA